MAKIVDLEGIRRTYVKSLYGRRFGMDDKDFLVGPRGLRNPIFGLAGNTSSVASSLQSTDVANYGVTVFGSSLIGLSTGYGLNAPEPGISKYLVSLTTAYTAITCDTGSFIMTSANSTGQVLVFEKGLTVELMGISTSLWALVNNPISSLSTLATIT